MVAGFKVDDLFNRVVEHRVRRQVLRDDLHLTK